MGRDRKSAGKIIIGLLTALLLLAIYGVVKDKKANDPPENESVVREPDRVDTGFILTGPDSYDSADTAILVSKNKKEGKATFFNLDRAKRYTLTMDGTTHLYDKYGESVSLEQIQVGDIVDITFLKGTRHLVAMQLSTRAWKNENVERYEFNSVRGDVTIGEDIYKLTKNTHFLSAGRSIGEMDLNAADVLSFQGIGNQVLSVSVEKGHGYLKLVNDENFVGGWIEIGQIHIQQITKDMLLVLPEGSYQVNISHKGGGGVKTAVINRNEETILDIGDLEIPEPQKGMVLFSISPSKAALYIDGTETDFSRPVDMEYGLHQLIVKADGYKSITQYIRVGQASAGVNIELEAMESEKNNDKDTTGQTSINTTDVSTDYYKVHVDAPEGVEAYLDGNYMGITPCSFRKTSGAHVLTLRKTGYKTRSYTIQMDSEDKDITYSFVDLEASPDTGSSSDPVDTSGLIADIIESVVGDD